MSLKILKSLYLFWFNFFKSYFNYIFLASSYMLSLTFSPCSFLLFLLNYFFITSFVISINIFALFQLLCIPLRKSFSFGNSILIVRFLFYGCLSKLSLNGIYPMAVYFLSLYWNSASDNYSV